MVIQCKFCNGKGKRRGMGWILEDCQKCGGTGKLEIKSTIEDAPKEVEPKAAPKPKKKEAKEDK